MYPSLKVNTSKWRSVHKNISTHSGAKYRKRSKMCNGDHV